MYTASQYSDVPESTYHQVAQNSCYDLSVDKARNRVYFTIHGYWKSKSAVPDLLGDWKKIIALTQPGFTVLTDMRTMITHPQEMNELHMAAQQIIIDSGVRQVAHVMPTDKIAHLQLNSFKTNSTLPYRTFNSVEEAETWLNQHGQASLN
ncbi:hypothetical protein H7F15_00780 [Pontibacter sp. Tf4]|uniref:hypothetical protein n=1 Tax=Pontibacter sp. Tf4 TaxID=2761620 RepID=UPI001629E00A|nr:hypothetical protein [Pontibacter sp. Tf4]MBB6609559.1 hypothetical protein [Pontibacter sp. Tf4]